MTKRVTTLNAQIAEGLFGWHWFEREFLPGGNYRCQRCHAPTAGYSKHLGMADEIPDYCGKPGLAWLVVDALAKDKGVVNIAWDGTDCVVQITGWRKGVFGQHISERAATMPMAVCLAAVAAFRLDEDDDESYELREVSNRIDSEEAADGA